MAIYYVTINRPTIEAESPEEAAQKAISDPLEEDDVVYVKNIPEDGSMFYVPGTRASLGGGVPLPDGTFHGPDLIVEPTSPGIYKKGI